MLPAATERTPAAAEHLDRPQRRGRLAVRAGDGEHRPRPTGTILLPLVGELDLAGEAHATGPCRVHHADGPRERRAPGRPRRSRRRAHRARSRRGRCAGRRPARRRARGGRGVSVSSTAITSMPRAHRAHRRRAGHREPVHERACHGESGVATERQRGSGKRPRGRGTRACRSSGDAGEVADEDAEGDGHADRRDQPEADDHGRLGPADELEVVVDRRHAEQALLAAAGLEHASSARRPSRLPSR